MSDSKRVFDPELRIAWIEGAGNHAEARRSPHTPWLKEVRAIQQVEYLDAKLQPVTVRQAEVPLNSKVDLCESRAARDVARSSSPGKGFRELERIRVKPLTRGLWTVIRILTRNEIGIRRPRTICVVDLEQRRERETVLEGQDSLDLPP